MEEQVRFWMNRSDLGRIRSDFRITDPILDKTDYILEEKDQILEELAQILEDSIKFWNNRPDFG